MDCSVYSRSVFFCIRTWFFFCPKKLWKCFLLHLRSFFCSEDTQIFLIPLSPLHLMLWRRQIDEPHVWNITLKNTSTMKYIHWHFSKSSVCLINIYKCYVNVGCWLWELALDDLPQACTKMHFCILAFLVLKFDKNYEYWQNSSFFFIITLRIDLI